MTMVNSPGLIRSQRPRVQHVTRRGTASDVPYDSAGEVGGKL
jgi:hypothetical protein